MPAMAIKPKSNLDDFVSAAGASVGSSHSTASSPSIAGTQPKAVGDLQALIAAAAWQKHTVDSGSTRKVGAGETAAQRDFSADLGLDVLVHEASRSVGGALPVSPVNSPSVASDINQLIAHVAGRPASADRISTVASVPAAVTVPQEMLVASGEKTETARPAKRSASRNVGPWVTAVVIAAIVGGVVWFGFPHRETKALPTIAGGPKFPLTEKEKELVEHLRAAHAEVERYRMANGSLPTKIDMKVRGVVFHIRPVKDTHMIMAVSEQQHLVLMGDGRWHKAQ